MIDIQLDKEYKLTSDSMNYILEKRSSEPSEKTGKYSWRAIMWTGTVQLMMKAYKELKIRESDSTTIQELLEVCEKTDKRIEKILKGL